ncbi:MAG TPA: phosphotransferase [Pirellulales bacterium]|jgi:dTDP-glucose pyrophosphorylase|nr:phosphotransferase [Pirellulales bacterium]
MSPSQEDSQPHDSSGGARPALSPFGLDHRDRLAETVVLIPAAGRVPENVMALSNITCPAMVPVAGRPVIYWTVRYLQSLGLRRFVMAVARRGLFVEDFVECALGQDCEIRFLVPSRDGGVGRTVLELAEEAVGRSALVVLGDTHFQFADPQLLVRDEPVVMVHPVDDSYRWCVAETDSQGLVTCLHDKQPGLPAPVDALIGVYYFPDLDALRTGARQAVATAETAGRRTEMAGILDNVARHSPLRAVRAGDWLDCGNPDRQASSHRTLLQKRAFNELSIDSTFGTVTKRSRYVDKFLDEINYLRLLPPELSVLFPRVVACSTDWEDPWLTMEYYGYPTLAEVFVFENVDPAIWEQVFVHLRDIVVGGFMQRRRPLASGVLEEMYLGKTRRRLAGITEPPALRELVAHEGPILLNGREVANLPSLWKMLESEVERLADTVQGCVVHGDLCLSNILYDMRSRICKLIDPRGSFGPAGIYGDPRYDVAKLFHSVYGLYDFIVNDLFHVSVEGNRIDLDIRHRPQHREIQKRFEKVFFADFDRREILLLTGLLFASMPALHYDAPNRQLAMYARALELFAELFSPSTIAVERV